MKSGLSTDSINPTRLKINLGLPEPEVEAPLQDVLCLSLRMQALRLVVNFHANAWENNNFMNNAPPNSAKYICLNRENKLTLFLNFGADPPSYLKIYTILEIIKITTS